MLDEYIERRPFAPIKSMGPVAELPGRRVGRRPSARSAERAVDRKRLVAVRPRFPFVPPVGATVGPRLVGWGWGVQRGLDALVVLGVLQEVLRGNAVSGGKGIAGQPVIALRDLAGGSPNLDAGATIAFEGLVWTRCRVEPEAGRDGGVGRWGV